MDEFQRLENMAAAADADAHAIDNPPAPGAAPGPGGELVPLQPTGPDYGMEAAMMVDLFAGMACGYAPAAQAVWTDPAKMRTALALAPVLAKYNVSMGALPPEVVLIVVAGPLLWQTARCVALQAASDKRKADAARTVEAGGQAGPAAVTQHPGQAPAAPPAAAPGGSPAPAMHSQVALYQGG